MKRRRGNSGGLVRWLLLIKRLIGTTAVVGIFYLTIPWGMIGVVRRGEDITPTEFTEAISTWAIGLVDNILLIALLMFIAVLTYGPEALDLLAGSERKNSPPGPRF